MTTPLIYNLFPRLAGTMDRWLPHCERARGMGFHFLYINPVSYPGFSGSLYSVKDYYRVCPDFLPAGTVGNGLDVLQRTLRGIRELGLVPVMDLVVNHTAIDSDLTHEHPSWYVRDARGKLVSPSAIDPSDARNITVWGDLAEIDNDHSPDRENLWAYWRALVRSSLALGWGGFRCDAAYKVPAELWRSLIDEARAIDAGVVFFAETLGCRLEQVRAVKDAGFDYLFNSSKYWNFDAPWAIDQHNEFGTIGPSIGFPESHDTKRLYTETGGNLAVQRQRYVLAAFFSSGVLLPMGYEYCFRRKLDVVRSRPADWEESGRDLSAFMGAVNRLKGSQPVLREEGTWANLTSFDRSTIVLEKTVPGQRALFLVNKDWNEPQDVSLGGIHREPTARLRRFDEQGRLSDEPVPAKLRLAPAEIAIVN